MSELLPTLRESLRDTAERRHRRRRRRAPLIPAALALAAVAAALLIARELETTQPADEVPVTPTATPTVTVTPTPMRTPAVHIDPKDLRATPVDPDSPSLKEALSLMDPSHQVVRAWKVPGLKGHVLLTRKGGSYCLSAPDPLTQHPDAERGVGCTPPARREKHGDYIGIGNIDITLPAGSATLRIRER
jgi:hypothetical protein